MQDFLPLAGTLGPKPSHGGPDKASAQSFLSCLRSLSAPRALRAPRVQAARVTRVGLVSVACLASVASLGGCATAFAPAAPELDARLGTATRQALAQQVLRPQAGAAASDATAPFDGVAAVHTLTRHREGFKAPPASFNVLGIGSGSGQP